MFRFSWKWRSYSPIKVTEIRQQVCNCLQRYGELNEHNGWIGNLWLEGWAEAAIIEFHLKNPLEGYRWLTFMMLEPTSWRSARPAGAQAGRTPVEVEH